MASTTRAPAALLPSPKAPSPFVYLSLPSELRLEIFSALNSLHSLDWDGHIPRGFRGSKAPIAKNAITDVIALSQTCRLLRKEILYEAKFRGMGFPKLEDNEEKFRDADKHEAQTRTLFGEDVSRIVFAVPDSVIVLDSAPMDRMLVDPSYRFERVFPTRFDSLCQIFGLTPHGDTHALLNPVYTRYKNGLRALASAVKPSFPALYSKILLVRTNRFDTFRTVTKFLAVSTFEDRIFYDDFFPFTSIGVIEVHLSIPEFWPTCVARGRIGDFKSEDVAGYQFFPVVACMALLIALPPPAKKITIVGLGPLYDNFIRDWEIIVSSDDDCGLRRLLHRFPFLEELSFTEEQLRGPVGVTRLPTQWENILNWATSLEPTSPPPWDVVVELGLKSRFHWEFRR